MKLSLNQKLATGAGALAILALIAGSRTPSNSVDLAAFGRRPQLIERQLASHEDADIAVIEKRPAPAMRRRGIQPSESFV